MKCCYMMLPLHNYLLTRICFQLKVIIASMSCHYLSRTSWLFYLRVLECLWTLSRRWILELSLRISVSSSISLLSTCWHMRAKTATISLQECREAYPPHIAHKYSSYRSYKPIFQASQYVCKQVGEMQRCLFSCQLVDEIFTQHCHD